MSSITCLSPKIAPRRRISAILAIGAVMLGVFAAWMASATSTEAATEKSIRIAHLQGFGSVPVKVAQEKGFFKANGLRATLVPELDPTGALAATGKQLD